MKYLGFSGRARSGKDTCATFASQILHEHGIEAGRVAFGTAIKEVTYKVFGRALNVPREAFYGSQEQKELEIKELPGWTGRKLMQHIGTKGFREIFEHVWTLYAFNHAKEIYRNVAEVVIFTDVRFIDEANTIQSHGGKVVRVKRPSVDTSETTGFPGHRSELELESINPDYVINGKDGELTDLKEQVRECLRNLHFLPST